LWSWRLMCLGVDVRTAGFATGCRDLETVYESDASGVGKQIVGTHLQH
jgi:hypothetical protein